MKLFLLLDDLEVSIDVAGADRSASLEHHVLEEVADARDPWMLVGGADMRDSAGGDGRELWS